MPTSIVSESRRYSVKQKDACFTLDIDVVQAVLKESGILTIMTKYLKTQHGGCSEHSPLSKTRKSSPSPRFELGPWFFSLTQPIELCIAHFQTSYLR